MTVELPSGHAAPSMTSLDRVTRLAYEHGYRVGLQIGEHGIIAAHVRDIEGEQKMIAVLGRTIEEASVELLRRFVASGYIPRHIKNKG